MRLGLGLGLNRMQQGGRTSPKPPIVEDTLCKAIEQKHRVNVTFEGEQFEFSPLVVYEFEGTIYVDGVVGTSETPGNRPPPLSYFDVPSIASATMTDTAFEVHSATRGILRRYQNVKCIVE